MLALRGGNTVVGLPEIPVGLAPVNPIVLINRGALPVLLKVNVCEVLVVFSV